jgi:flagellar biosynthesis/type III secretory pathway protein FliH
MSNGIYLTLEQYKDKDLPLTITINGHTYHSQFALATAQATYFEMGKQHGMELGGDKTYSDKDMTRYGHAWYDEGYTKGYDDGISKINLNTEPVEQTELSKEYDKGFTKGYEEGFEEGKSEGYEIGKKANGISKKEIPGEWLSRIEEARKQGYADGYKDCREVANCREVAKMLNKYGIDEDYDKGYKVGYEAGKVDNPQYMRAYQAGRNDGFDECKRDSISAKEIPGESLAHIEEARLMGYEEGYIDAKEGGQAEGYIDRREKSKPMMESGDDEEDGEPIGPEHPEYDKGYYAGWEDGKNHIMQFIGQ